MREVIFKLLMKLAQFYCMPQYVDINTRDLIISRLLINHNVSCIGYLATTCNTSGVTLN